LDKLDNIIRRAYQDLDYFYGRFGEWNGTGKLPAYKPLSAPKTNQEAKKTIDLRNKSAKDIIDTIFIETGKKIEICVKSKKSILRHAEDILKTHNFKYKIPA